MVIKWKNVHDYHNRVIPEIVRFPEDVDEEDKDNDLAENVETPTEVYKEDWDIAPAKQKHADEPDSCNLYSNGA
jgi:hypothetical protein